MLQSNLQVLLIAPFASRVGPATEQIRDPCQAWDLESRCWRIVHAIDQGPRLAYTPLSLRDAGQGLGYVAATAAPRLLSCEELVCFGRGVQGTHSSLDKSHRGTFCEIVIREFSRGADKMTWEFY